MAAEFRLGIQSYCFRKFQPISRLIDCLRQVGLKYVEIWPGHLDLNAGSDAVRQGLDAVRQAGIKIDSFGTVRFGNDEAAVRQVLDFCRLAGLRSFTCADVADEAVAMVDRLCDEYDLNLAIHNHGRKHSLGRYEAMQRLFSRTSKRFGVCLDTAWALDAGEDPLAALDLFGERLYGVHLKDFVFDASGKPKDVILGQGGLDMPAFMAKLNAMNYAGYLSIEYEGNPDDPMAEVGQCVGVVRDTIASLSGKGPGKKRK